LLVAFTWTLLLYSYLAAPSTVPALLGFRFNVR